MKKRKKIFSLMILAAVSVLSSSAQQKPVVPRFIEVGFLKTIHISFPSKINYVDLGSNYIIAGKADEAENVLRVKAAYQGFKEETNFSVICEDGSFYLFTAKFNDHPKQQYYEMKSAISTLASERPTNGQEVILKELNGESPVMLGLIMNSLYKKNTRDITHIGERKERIEATVKGIYVHNDILYLHLNIRNKSNVSYDIDYLKFTETDQKKIKKQASQDLPIIPVREYNGENKAKALVKETYRTIIAFNKFTLSSDKVLVVSIAEKNGGRHIQFTINPSDIVSALPIKGVQL